MPLPKNMKKCMRKVTKEFPKGRSDKEKSKNDAHKQHVAMCLAQQESEKPMLSFKNFLFEESNRPSPTSFTAAYYTARKKSGAPKDKIPTLPEIAKEYGINDPASLELDPAEFPQIVNDIIDNYIFPDGPRGVNLSDMKSQSDYDAEQQAMDAEPEDPRGPGVQSGTRRGAYDTQARRMQKALDAGPVEEPRKRGKKTNYSIEDVMSVAQEHMQAGSLAAKIDGKSFRQRLLDLGVPDKGRTNVINKIKRSL